MNKYEIFDTINASIQPYAVNQDSLVFKNLVKGGFTKEEFQAAIEIAEDAYLKYDEEEGLIEASVEVFLKKLGGILFNRRQATEEPEWDTFAKAMLAKYGYAKSWVKAKTLNELKILYKAGVSIQDLYALSLNTTKWAEIYKKAQDGNFEQALLGDNNVSK